MVEIPDHLLRRSAEAKAKALGVPVEEVLSEMRGEAAAAPPASDQASAAAASQPSGETTQEPESPESDVASDPQPVSGTATDVDPVGEVVEDPPTGAEQPSELDVAAEPVPEVAVAEPAKVAELPSAETESEAEVAEGGSAAVGGGSGATLVSPRPVAQPEAVPEGVRTQRLLTVVKARAIQQVKSSPADKVNTWPHLMIAEFTALLAMTGFLIILSVILQAPLLELANFNATPNPSKAPWYFLGLQELLSYYDPQIAGVVIPTVTGLIGFMAIPYVDRNPSTKPSDRKFAIMLYTFFLAGSATLTLIGTLFRGPGFNFTYPWADGIWFDDLKDWVNFE